MSQAQGRDDLKRRKAVRRHRRERQTVVFGIALIGLAAVGFAAAVVYQGEAEGPFAAEFHTPVGEFESDVSLACPAPGSNPLPYEEVVVRVSNGTQVSGLAGSVGETLEGRGFEVVDTMNWSRAYGDHIQILYGREGLQHAYTLATHFDQVDLVLDSREDITLDLVLGEQFAVDPALREMLSPELDSELPLAARGECLPAHLIQAQLAPRTLPDNPFAEPEPEASPDAEAEEGDGEGEGEGEGDEE